MLKLIAARACQAMLAAVVGMALIVPGAVQARAPAPLPDGALPAIALAELPREGRATYALIRQGGPFAYDKDGSVFGNRERILPPHKRGYYREYTVRTPGARNRGARRIICGGPQPTAPQACYYTSDHYASFRQIVE